MKINILMLNYEFPPLGGGSANATYYLLKEFSKDPSLRVDLVTSGSGPKLEVERFSEGITFFKLPVGKREPHFWTMSEIARWTWRALRFSRNLTRERDYDLCHCWSGWPSGIIGLLLRKRIPYIVGLRGSDVPGYNLRLRVLDRIAFRYISPFVWNRARGVTAVSDHLRELAEKTSKRCPIQVIYNGVDAKHFQPGTPPARFTVLYVGRLIERKGLIYLLRAFRSLSEELPDCRLLIAGEGPDRQGLMEFCLRERIESRVSSLGVLDHDELRAVYQRVSVFVMPALEEAMPNAMLEAMASGLPLISSNTGARELLDGNGIVVETGNAAQLKEALSRYATDPFLRKRHGERSRILAETMAWSGVALAYRDLYEQIVRDRMRRAS